ncbi:hypothetical protein F4781DRAFT_384405 [Annulohypoxylon bovei var. microspora]|nr:hypothetical protein F4781DRAFT_384405 [Annulohypoxylon bovei var. microspora]
MLESLSGPILGFGIWIIARLVALCFSTRQLCILPAQVPRRQVRLQHSHLIDEPKCIMTSIKIPKIPKDPLDFPSVTHLASFASCLFATLWLGNQTRDIHMSR